MRLTRCLLCYRGHYCFLIDWFIYETDALPTVLPRPLLFFDWFIYLWDWRAAYCVTEATIVFWLIDLFMRLTRCLLCYRGHYCFLIDWFIYETDALPTLLPRPLLFFDWLIYLGDWRAAYCVTEATIVFWLIDLFMRLTRCLLCYRGHYCFLIDWFI